MANPLVTNVDVYKAPLDVKTATFTLELAQVVQQGEMLGINTSTGEYKTLDSAAIDGSQFARGIAFAAADATVAAVSITVIIAGQVDSSKLIFSNIADDLTTVPVGTTDSYYQQLRDFVTFAENTSDLFSLDNQ